MEFKVGDIVERLSSSHMGMNIGDRSVITSFVRKTAVHLKDFKGNHSTGNLKLAKTWKQIIEGG